MTDTYAALLQAQAEARHNLGDLPDSAGQVPAIRYAGLSLPHGWWAIRNGPNGVETAWCPSLERADAYIDRS